MTGGGGAGPAAAVREAASLRRRGGGGGSGLRLAAGVRAGRRGRLADGGGSALSWSRLGCVAAAGEESWTGGEERAEPPGSPAGRAGPARSAGRDPEEPVRGVSPALPGAHLRGF